MLKQKNVQFLLFPHYYYCYCYFTVTILDILEALLGILSSAPPATFPPTVWLCVHFRVQKSPRNYTPGCPYLGSGKIKRRNL